ncbi:hypothetical protein N0V82_004123 [Gnomoniopsis sp. IMI 355080]|nr:hypothetical protein N0V82_004123 [Gnomoniopsis sp. IMI 355080]
MDGKHVRILQLHPGRYSDAIFVTLEVCNLDEIDDQYEALSYVWGVPAIDGVQINCGGRFLSPYGGGKNLEAALRALRSTRQTRRIWVDAICIDQNNDLEKGHQVGIMSEIYSRAHSVIAYTNVADRTVEPRLTEVAAEILCFLTGDQPFDDDTPWSRLPRAEVVAALREFLKLEYFKRVWVVQEAALARRIQMVIGHSIINWSSGQDTRRFLNRIKLAEISPSWKTADAGQQDGLASLDFKPMIELLELSLATLARREGRVEPISLLDIVHSMKHRKAGTPNDSIYGMLGLLTPAEVSRLAHDGFDPNYERPWEETYRKFFDVMEARVLQSGSPSISLTDKKGRGLLETSFT